MSRPSGNVRSTTYLGTAAPPFADSSSGRPGTTPACGRRPPPASGHPPILARLHPQIDLNIWGPTLHYEPHCHPERAKDLSPTTWCSGDRRQEIKLLPIWSLAVSDNLPRVV